MSHKSRNLRRKIQKGWAIERMKDRKEKLDELKKLILKPRQPEEL